MFLFATTNNRKALQSSMNIVTSIDCEINTFENNFYCGIDQAVIKKLNENGFGTNRYIQYRFHVNRRILTLLCPVLDIGNGRCTVVLWPSGKLPFRSYPVHVYLYAIAIYLAGNISMREAAAKTRRKFHLEKFSHSTVSRTLKKLSENDALPVLSGQAFPDVGLHVRKHWDDNRRQRYHTLLCVLKPVLCNESGAGFGATLNYNIFNATQKFLI